MRTRWVALARRDSMATVTRLCQVAPKTAPHEVIMSVRSLLLSSLFLIGGSLLIGGCGDDDKDDDDDDDEVVVTGIAALGGETHELDGVQMTIVGDSGDGLDVPRDLAFNPDEPDQLWVVNRADDSATIFTDVGLDDQDSDHRIDPYAFHFMEEVSSIAMGAVTFAGSDARTFGTCQESLNTYNGQGEENDFMGPTLWTADLDLFAESNPDAVEYLSELFGFRVDLGSHLDMLHESPLCMGIAWETENVYWVFEGDEGRIARYDFQEDHHMGFDDHTDGIVARYMGLQVLRVEDVPSHMEMDRETGLLYIADTGKNRIVVLDTATGTEGRSLRANEPGVDKYEMDDADYWKLIDGDDVDGMSAPSGLAIVDGHILITDFESGRIFAFTLEGELVDWADTGRGGGIMGIEARSLDDIWFVDGAADELVRLQP
jgi:hypothetical protein